jgi:hypothetical protein
MAHCLPARFPARRLLAREFHEAGGTQFHEAGGTPALPGFCRTAPMAGGIPPAWWILVFRPLVFVS